MKRVSQQVIRNAAGSVNLQPFRGLEALEDRMLMAVTQDAAGWTVVTPSDDTRVVYVSSSEGDDANSGLSKSAPVASLARAVSLLRANSPDWLLLKKGDTWVGQSFDNWAGGSGRGTQEPKLISSYGTGARPKILTPGVSGWSQRRNVTVSHLYIIGVHFQGDRRGAGLDRLAAGTDMLIEDTVFTQYGTGMAVQGYYAPIDSFRVRRSVIADNDGLSTGHSQGMYLDKTDNTVIEENVFWKNGWHLPDRSDATMFNHGMYLTAYNDDAIVRRNIVSESSSHGLQMRGGGLVQDNLFVRNPIGFSFGLVNGADLKPGGVAGEVSGNVVIASNDINAGARRGWGVELANIKGGVRVHDNIFTSDASLGDFAAIQLTVPNGTNNPHESPGIDGLTIENNIVYRWRGGLTIDGGYGLGGAGLSSIKGLVVRNNDFQVTTDGAALVNHPQAPSAGNELWEGNSYYTGGDAGNWFRQGWTPVSFNGWSAKFEPTAVNTRRPYADPDRGVESYHASIGGDGSFDSFIQSTVARSKDGWDARYTAGAVIGFIRQGFATGDPSRPTVSVSAASAETVEGSSSPAAFTVTRTGATDAPLTVHYSVGGSAGAGTDYVKLSGSVTIPAGASSASIFVSTVDDSVLEGNEVVSVTLSASPDAYNLGGTSASVTLRDDEQPLPEVTAVTWTGGSESDLVSPASFMLRRTGSTAQPLAVSYQLLGTATAGVDYVTPAHSVTFPAGADTLRLNLQVLDDAAVESVEKIRLVIVAGPGYTVPVGAAQPETSITDNDTGEPTPVDTVKPTANLSPISMTAGAPTLSFTVTYTDDVGINASTLGAGIDVAVTGPNGYSADGQLLYVDSWSDGQSRTGTYQVLAPGVGWDAADDGQYTVWLGGGQVADTSGNFADAVALGTFTVKLGGGTPNPAKPVVSVQATNNSIEGLTAPVRFTFTRTGPTTNPLTVNFTLGGEARANWDYLGAATSVAFAAGASTATLALTVVDDQAAEAGEVIRLKLVSDAGYTLGSPSEVSAAILDNGDTGPDLPPVSQPKPAVSVTASGKASEGSASSGLFTFTRAGSTASPLTVNFSLGGQASTADYATLPTSVTFPAGVATVTLSLSAVDDLLVEGPEQLGLTLLPAAAYTVTAPLAILTIADNDTAPPATVFSKADSYFGDRGNYAVTTPSRWSVRADQGDARLVLDTSDYVNLSGSRLGEMALAGGRSFTGFSLSVNARSMESLSGNTLADYAIVFGYVDVNNYCYLMMNASAQETALFRVASGVRSTIAVAGRAGIVDNDYHNVQVSRVGNTVTVMLDGKRILAASNAALGVAGQVGVGSFNDAAAFDDLTVLPIASPSRPVISPVQQPVMGSPLASAPASLFN